MAPIHFQAKLSEINSHTILKIPEDASAQLPSRGITMVSGTLNGVPFNALLEPDGKYGPGLKPSHWFKPDPELLKNAQINIGDVFEVSISPTKEWIEPDIPEDLIVALKNSPKAQAIWQEISPLAHWDWIRWIRAVKTPETRQEHIAVAIDKMNKGIKRPCCFNRSLCSDPEVSHKWVLLEPTT